MPEVCRFHNIRIVFNSREHHNVAHFHVVHPDFRASFDISNGGVMAGRIPSDFQGARTRLGPRASRGTYGRMAKGSNWRHPRQDSAANTKVIQNATVVRCALF